MRLPLLALALFLVLGFAFSYSANSSNYTLGSFHQGSAGAVMNSTSYSARATMDYNQPGNGNATTASYYLNVGWFEANITIILTTITITYPVNGTDVFQQCSFFVNSTVTFRDGTTGRQVNFTLYKDNHYFDSVVVPVVSSGLVYANFSGLIDVGDYNVTANASDSYGWAVAQAWESFNQMISCRLPDVGAADDAALIIFIAIGGLIMLVSRQKPLESQQEAVK